jgi:hypothetical protein
LLGRSWARGEVGDPELLEDGDGALGGEAGVEEQVSPAGDQRAEDAAVETVGPGSAAFQKTSSSVTSRL